MTDILQPYDYLVRNAKQIPGDIAITDGETTLTWHELFELTKRIARELRDRGVVPGDTVGTFLPPILTCFFTWAILHEAAAALPYFEGFEEPSELPLRLLVSTAPVPGFDPSRVLIINDEWFDAIHRNSIIIDQKTYPSPDSINRYAISSGTTGRPKMIPFSWTISANRAIGTFRRYRSTTIPMTMFGIRSEIGWQNFFGAAIYQHPYLIARDDVSTVDLMIHFKVDSLRASPFHLTSLASSIEERGVTLPDLRLIVPVGGQLSEKLDQKLKRITDAEVGNGYGVTEVGPIAFRDKRSADRSDAGAIVSSMEVQIVDPETLDVLPDGETGVIRARSSDMVSGYVNSPADTEKNFRGGWFYPGDLGRISDGSLFLVGRTTDLINSGGSKTDPAMVEEAFVDVSEIRECVAFGMPNSQGIDIISLAYVADRKLDGAELRALVEPVLGRHTPRNFYRVPEIPRGETGKPLRRELVNLVNLVTSAREAAVATSSTISSPSTTESAHVIPWPQEGEEVLQPFDYVAKHARERPSDIALTDGESTLTWKGLFDLSRSIAGELRARGLTPGDRVGVILPGFMTVVVMLGVFHEAAVFSALAPNLGTTNPLNFTMVVSNQPLPDWPAEKTLIVDLEWIQEIDGKHSDIEQLRYESLDSELHLSLTSGSTGTPKALSFTIAESTIRTIESFCWTAAKVKGMSFMPPRSQGWYHFYYNVILGTPYLVPSDGRHNVELIRRFAVDVIRASPAHLSQIVEELDRTDGTLPSLSLILATGGQLPEPLRQALKRVTNAEIGNAYGATEVGGVSMRRVDSTDHSDTGLIFPEAIVEIVDESTETPLPDGEIGVVRMRGKVTCTEYLGNPEVTAKHFRDGWFYSGDLGRIANGRLFILGRDSQLINAGGSKVDPVVIEQVFAGYMGIRDCAAFEIKNNRGVGRVALAYVGPSTLNAVDTHVTMIHKLGSAVPTKYFRVSEIPRGDTGKIKRDQLSKRFASLVTEDETIDAPNDGTFIQPFDYARRGWKANPDAPALIDSSGTLSRKDVTARAKQYAMFLREQGVQPGDIVMIQLDTVLQLTFTLAVFHEAAVVAPYVAEVVRDGSLDVRWVISKERLDDVPDFKNIVVGRMELAAMGRNTTMLPAREYPSPDSLLRIAFSSGTTGTPKPIPFTVVQTAERALDHESRTLNEHQFMCLMPPVRGMGWWSWYASVINQRPYIIPSTPTENIKLMRRMGVDSIVASPVQIAFIMRTLNETRTALPDLRIVQIAGSSLSTTIVNYVKTLTNAQVLNLYGSTEVGPTTVRRDDNDDPSYVGEVLPGLSVEIVDPETRHVMPDGQVGLVRTRSDTMAHEYLGNPEATAEAWQDGWFYSGDLGYLEGNKLFLAGRTSEVINAGGGKIDPSVIDAHFDDEVAFLDHAAFAITMPNGLDRVGLAYVAGETVDLDPVMARANEALKFHAPTVYMPVTEIPRNELGKPLRASLSERFAQTNTEER